MFNGKKKEIPAANTVIGTEVTIQGTAFTGSGTIRIDGKYIGEMNIQGSVVIGESGVVQGNIVATKMVIGGTVEGDVRCTEEAHLTATAKVSGNITTSVIVIDEGASFNGQCTTSASASSSALYVKPKQEYDEYKAEENA